MLSRRVKRQQLLDTVLSQPPCVIGMEAYGNAQQWGGGEQLAHMVKLRKLKYVRPYVKTNRIIVVILSEGQETVLFSVEIRQSVLLS